MSGKREPSTSITHLVKTVAGEVFDEREKRDRCEHDRAHREIQAALRTLSRKMNMIEYCLNDEVPPIDDCSERWDTPNAGDVWSNQEESELICDMRKAIKWMAARRGRTKGSIDARLALLMKGHRIF